MRRHLFVLLISAVALSGTASAFHAMPSMHAAPALHAGIIWGD